MFISIWCILHKVLGIILKKKFLLVFLNLCAEKYFESTIKLFEILEFRYEWVLCRTTLVRHEY